MRRGVCWSAGMEWASYGVAATTQRRAGRALRRVCGMDPAIWDFMATTPTTQAHTGRPPGSRRFCPKRCCCSRWRRPPSIAPGTGTWSGGAAGRPLECVHGLLPAGPACPSSVHQQRERAVVIPVDFPPSQPAPTADRRRPARLATREPAAGSPITALPSIARPLPSPTGCWLSICRQPARPPAAPPPVLVLVLVPLLDCAGLVAGARGGARPPDN